MRKTSNVTINKIIFFIEIPTPLCTLTKKFAVLSTNVRNDIWKQFGFFRFIHWRKIEFRFFSQYFTRLSTAFSKCCWNTFPVFGKLVLSIFGPIFFCHSVTLGTNRFCGIGQLPLFARLTWNWKHMGLLCKVCVPAGYEICSFPVIGCKNFLHLLYYNIFEQDGVRWFIFSKKVKEFRLVMRKSPVFPHLRRCWICFEARCQFQSIQL